MKATEQLTKTYGPDSAEDPSADASSGPYLSVVIPVYNEEDNVDPLHQRIAETLSSLEHEYEIIYVDDGSVDSSLEKLIRIAERDDHTVVVEFRRNFGQTAAMSAGIDHARGRVIVFLDADLQNDPADIPKLLEKLEEGYDTVSGWRKNRQDNFILRKIPSFFGNWTISSITGVKLKDYGCTLKAYRSEVIKNVRLYGEMHRFIPALVAQVGGTVAEIPVNHHPRLRGKSHYGLSRTFRVILDLLTVKFLAKYSRNPIYLFGGSGLILIAVSFVSGFGMLFQKIAYGVSFIQTPLLLLSALLFILGFHSILLGLTAEMLVRTYYESQRKPTYVVRRVFPSNR